MEIPPAEQSVNQMVATIHDMAASHAPVEISIGQVIAPFPDIQIACNNIILTKEQLYVDAFLMTGYVRTARGDIKLPNAKGGYKTGDAKGNIRTTTAPKAGGAGRPSFVPHSHKVRGGYKADIKGSYDADISSDYTDSVITTSFGLQVGDLVALLPIYGGQAYVVAAKVFYLAEWKGD